MKTAKKLIAFVLIAALSMSLSVVAMADEGLNNESIVTEINSEAAALQEEAPAASEAPVVQEVGEVLPVDEEIVLASGTLDIEDSFDEFEPVDVGDTITLPKAAASRSSIKRGSAIKLDGDLADRPQRGQESGTMVAESPKTKAGIDTFSTAAYGYDLYSYTGTINVANGSASLYPIWLGDGETLQARLITPAGVDYDLYLMAFDMSTGNLISTPISYSNHSNASSSLTESVGAVNNTGSDAAYYLEVYAKTGYSASNQFTLYLSYSDEPDVYESDQNAWSAPQGELAGLALGTTKTTSTRTLNSPIDEDWFAVNIPSNSEMNALMIKATNNDVKIEMYAATLDSNGNVQFNRLSQSSDGTLFQPNNGTTYMRVLSKSASVVGNYTVSVSPVGIVSSASYRILNNGSPWRTQIYSVPNAERYAITGGATVTIEYTFKTLSGAPASFADYSGSWSISNYAWNPSAISYYTQAYKSGANANGILAVTGTGPAVLGEYYSSTTNSRWDYSVFMDAELNGEYLMSSYPIYVTSRLLS